MSKDSSASSNIDAINNKFKKFWAHLANLYMQPLQALREATTKLKDVAHTNYELGLYHLRRGNIYDAKLRFKMVIWMRPNNFMAYYRLGHCFLISQEHEKAKKYFESCLKLNPNCEEAKYMLSTFDKTVKQPDHIPLTIIEEYFDDIADEYQHEFVEKLGYKGPALLYEAAHELIASLPKEETSSISMLDIGCGTGLCGIYFKERMNIGFLTGIDLANGMLMQARQTKVVDRPVYDNLVKTELSQYLAHSSKKFHIITAAYSLHYGPNLAEVLKLCAKNLYPRGILAFSVQKSNSGEMVLNEQKENFCYSKPYIEKITAEAGFKCIKLDEVKIHDQTNAVQFVGQIA